MSVVVYSNGVLAADSKAYGGRNACSPGIKRKIHRLDDGTRVGIVSAKPGEPERFLTWMAAGADPAKWAGEKPDINAIIIKPDGAVFIAVDSCWLSGPIQSDQHALGSGAEFALGALAAGASAEESVRIACVFDCHNSGGPVTVLEAYPAGDGRQDKEGAA